MAPPPGPYKPMVLVLAVHQHHIGSKLTGLGMITSGCSCHRKRQRYSMYLLYTASSLKHTYQKPTESDQASRLTTNFQQIQETEAYDKTHNSNASSKILNVGTLQANALIFTQTIRKGAKRGRTNLQSSINQSQCVTLIWVLNRTN